MELRGTVLELRGMILDLGGRILELRGTILELGETILSPLKNSEYDQEIPQSQTTDNPVAEEPLNHHGTPGRQIKQSNQLSLPHQDDCNTRMDIK